MVKYCSSLLLVIACVACGSSFSAHDGGGSAGSGNGGEANGGEPSATGGSDTGAAGDPSGGGSDAGGTAGSSDAGGAGTGKGGAATGGSGGSSADDQCTRLKEQYQAALEKARMCDPGSTDECSPSSTVEPLNCGCPVLVNAQSEATSAAKKARQAYRDAKCADGTVCPAIACAQPAAVSCATAALGANTFVCAAGTAVAN